jgi:hypothetical protein
VAGIELQTFGRAGAAVAWRTDGREDIVLDRLKIRGQGAARVPRRNRLPVRIETFSIAGASRSAACQQEHGHTSESG